MRNFILFLGFFFIAISFASAQEVVYEGRLTDFDSDDDLSGVTISAIANGSVVYSTSTSKRGNYTVKLPIGQVYKIKYMKNGYVTKVMKVDVTSVNEEDLPIGGRIMPPVDIDLFTERENVDFSFLEEEPVVEWDYDENQFVMDWDRQVYSKMKKKIEDKLEEAENKSKEQEANYNKLISDADKLFDGEDYENALTKYEEALLIPGKASEEHPNNRVLEIEELLQNQAEEKLANEQANQEYTNLIEAADNLAGQKKYDGAIAKYEEAIEMKPDEQYPKDQVAALIAQKDKESKQEEYDQLIDRADGFFEQNSLKAARDFYEQAQRLIPSEQYPKDQLQLIEDKLKEQESIREQKENYEQAIAEADEFFDAENYESAIEKYEEAITFESAATYPVERIKLAKEALAKLNAENEKKEQFDALIKEADQLVISGDYEEAISKYDEALLIMEDASAKDKKEKAQELLDKDLAKKEQKEKIEALLVSAEEKMGNEEYEGALADYQEVIVLDQNNTDAIEGKAAAEKAIAQLKKLAEKKEQFDQYVLQGDEAFNSEGWEEARNNYQAAKDIFNDDEHVNDRLELIAQKISESEQLEQINNQIEILLNQADGLKKDDEWKLVVDKYDEALALDDSRDDVRQLLEEAKLSLAEWNKNQDQQARFEKLKLEGDEMFVQENWSDAKVKYEEALTIQDNSDIRSNIEAINEKLAELESEKEQEERFNELVADAESLESNEEFENAIDKYREALTIKSSADIENKIAELEDKLAKLEKSAETQEVYDAAMEKGQEALDKNDYASAIKSFEDALLAIPMDKEATRLRNEAQDALSDLRSEEEKYNSLLEKGESALQNEELEDAKKFYENAQSMRPKATLPQDKIIEIDELLRKKKEELESLNEEEKVNQEYQNKLELAEVAAGNFKYDDAIDHLKEALKLKPAEDLPKKKIKEYQALLDQISAQNAKEKKYSDLVLEADEAFDNESYEESIELYNEALTVKSNETYPKTQIGKAKDALKAAENLDLNRKYNNLIDIADKSFANEEYQEAIDNYKKALEEKPGDQYSIDKIEESKQILDNLKAEKEQAEKSNSEYNKFISEADKLYDQKEFIEAKKKYESALQVKPNDQYAIRRIKESVESAKIKVDQGDELRYQKILSKADEYFGEENYEKATSLYKRALSLRSYDQYPKDKLDEIKGIQNGTIKTKEELEYLGEKENISIIDGMALLDKAEDQRENLKQEKIKKIIDKNEGQELDRRIVDKSNQDEYTNEITNIYDMRSELIRVEQDNKDNTIVKLDDQVFSFEQLSYQENNFDRAEILRENEKVTYVLDDYSEHHQSKYDDHSEVIESLKVIQKSKDDRAKAEKVKERVGVLSTRDQLVEIQNDQEREILRATEMRKENEVEIDVLQQSKENRVFTENNLEYERVQQMQSEALLAELRSQESEEEKQVIQDQLKEDIKMLEGKIRDKNRDETSELYEEQLNADADLTRREEQYQKSQEGNDDQRMEAVEQLKIVKEDQEKVAIGRDKQEEDETQKNIEHSDFIAEKGYEQLDEHREDQVVSNGIVKEKAVQYEREVNMKSNSKEQKIEQTSDEIERLKVKEELIVSEKAESIDENVEKVKGVEASINAGENKRQEALKDDKLKSQELLDNIEVKQTSHKAKMANTIGDDFPEGVSQETYIRRDKDGIPYKIITRRIVVSEGFGEVYIRIQTKNGITYSKNDSAISEDAWIRATEDANLVQHF